MSDYQAVFFDFDGVIGKTLEDNYVAWEHAFSPWNVKIDRDEYFLMEGRKSTEMVRHFLRKNGLDPEMAPEIIDRKNVFYAAHNTFGIYEGVEELVQALKEQSIKVGVVSGGSAKRLRQPPSSDILPLFDVVVTGDDSPVCKPAPDPYLIAARKLNVPPATCLVIENAPLGIQSAKSAGMECIALCSTLAGKYLGQADRVLENISELRGLLVKRSEQTNE